MLIKFSKIFTVWLQPPDAQGSDSNTEHEMRSGTVAHRSRFVAFVSQAPRLTQQKFVTMALKHIS